MPPSLYRVPSSTGIKISMRLPVDGRSVNGLIPPASRICVTGSDVSALKYPRSCSAWRTRSVSSSSLLASNVRANMFSRMIEWGIPIGFRFCIAARRVRSLTSVLPSNSILPTFTVGPSLILNVTATDAGGIVLISVRMVANWCPCSASNCFSTVSARFTFVSSNWLSTENGTFVLLVPLQHVRLRNRVQPLVVDLADGRLLHHDESPVARTSESLPAQSGSSRSIPCSTES